MKRLWVDAALALLLAGALLLLPTRAIWRPAHAGVSCSVPFNLTNGSNADASQVMANYNAILACLATGTAESGANSSITSLSGLTTPISPVQGGTTVYIGGTSTGSANAQVVATSVPIGFSLSTKSTIVFLAGFTNSTATTLTVGGTGAVNIFKQTIAGPVALTGGEIVVGQLVTATYDGTQYEISTFPNVLAGWGIAVAGGATVSVATANPPYGVSECVNLQLNVTVATNNLTVAIKGNNGSDPSATNPVLCPFSDTTETNGGPVWVSTTAALSFSANSGSSFGSTNAILQRFWIVGFNNAGTLSIGVINASNTSQIFPLNEGVLTSTTACNACGTAATAGVFYTTTALTSKAFRILGYFEATEATAGTWATGATRIKLFGPGMKKPGDVVQTVYVSATTTATVSASTTKVATAVTGSISPTSAVNLVRVTAMGAVEFAPGGATTTAGITQLYRGTTTAIGNLSTVSNTSGVITNMPVSLFVLDNPATVSATSYTVYINLTLATAGVSLVWLATNYSIPANSGVMAIDEIMGALEPANDNLGPLSATG